jgi:hypothetical protein
METKEFDLKRVTIKSYDDEYYQWRINSTTFIITERGNENTYLGTNSIFRTFEEMTKSHYEYITEHTATYLKCPTIEIEHLAMVMESELETIKNVFQVEGESKYLKTIYLRVQHYGGSEEGGWYYHTMQATTNTSEDVETGTDRYGEGYCKEKEFYFGEHENLETQHYC